MVYGYGFIVYVLRFMVVFYSYGLLLLNIKFEALEIFDSRRLIPRVSPFGRNNGWYLSQDEPFSLEMERRNCF